MKIRGDTVISDYRTGRILFAHHNVITNTGKTRAAELLGGLAGVTPPDRFIKFMAVGDGGASSASPSTPFIPLATNTGLANELARVSALNPIVIGVNQLKFQSLFLTTPPLPFASPTFKVINEVGLFFGDDVQPGTPRMFARNTYPSIPFDTTDREGVIVSWTVSIV